MNLCLKLNQVQLIMFKVWKIKNMLFVNLDNLNLIYYWLKRFHSWNGWNLDQTLDIKIILTCKFVDLNIKR